MLANRRVLVAIHLPADVAGLIGVARAISSMMEGNPNFPSPSPPLAAVNQAIAELDAAQLVVMTRVRGSVDTRNRKRAVLVTLLYGLKAHVQSVVDAGDPEHAPTVIASAGMKISKPHARVPQRFGVRSGKMSGSVVVVAKFAGRRAAYEWQSSGDGGATWQSLRVTMQAKITVTGLKPGSTWLFRVRAVTKAGAGDWSEAAEIIVR